MSRLSQQESLFIERFTKFMSALCRRPQMFLLRAEMPRVRAMLDGYNYACCDTGEVDTYLLGEFAVWLESQHDICHAAWSWDRILVHAAGSEAEAIRTMPERFAKFLDDRKIGLVDVNAARSFKPGPTETCTVGYDKL